MDNAEKLMREMGEAIEKMKSIPDYKTRMNEEVALMHKERFKKTLYEKIQEMSREEVAVFLTNIYASSMVGAERAVFLGLFGPSDSYKRQYEQMLEMLDEPYDDEEDENET